MEVERLAAEVANLAHETETEAIQRAILERRTRLHADTGKSAERQSLQEYLERSVWPLVPAGEVGRVLSRKDEDQIFGYGPEGY